MGMVSENITSPRENLLEVKGWSLVMKYVFLGGAGEVGASCLLLSVGEKNILIDAGVRINESGEASLPDFKKLKKMAPTLDAIFISHAHADHVGALPLVHQMFPHTPIYATLPTQRLSTVMLGDAVRVQESSEEKLFNQELALVHAEPRGTDALRERMYKNYIRFGRFGSPL